MHEDQIDIDAVTVRALVADAFPHLDGEPVARVSGSGTVSAIWRIGDGLAARFPLRTEEADRLAEALRAEQLALAELASVCPVASPQPRGIGAPGHGYPLPWSLQTWVDGETATPTSCAGSAAFARDLAGLIRSLRVVPVRGRSFSGSGRGGELTDHDAWVTECLDRSTHLLDVPALAALWSRLRALPAGAAHVMSHTDLIPPNLLVDGDRLVGVLDGGGFQPADPSLDLVAAWHLLDADARQILRRAVGSGEIEWLRGAAWAFEQAIGLVWYYETTNPTMAELGRSTLARLLADPGVGGAPGPVRDPAVPPSAAG